MLQAEVTLLKADGSVIRTLQIPLLLYLLLPLPEQGPSFPGT